MCECMCGCEESESLCACLKKKTVSYSTESYRSSVRRTLRFKSDSPTDAMFYVSVS